MSRTSSNSGSAVSANKALPRPRVREIHSDREGKLVSAYFKDLCASESLHHTTSPPHDHDLNPIAERTIGLVLPPSPVLYALYYIHIGDQRRVKG